MTGCPLPWAGCLLTAQCGQDPALRPNVSLWPLATRTLHSEQNLPPASGRVGPSTVLHSFCSSQAVSLPSPCPRMAHWVPAGVSEGTPCSWAWPAMMRPAKFLSVCCPRALAGAPTPGLARTRLVNGSSSCSGRVEVLHNSTWGTVCDKGWNLTEAQVVCEEVGCGRAVSARAGAAFGQGSGPIWLENVMCAGTEAALSLCRAELWGSRDCHHTEDAGVECAGTS